MAKKILIIEDEEVLANVLRKKLTDSGYDVVVASDGDTGLDKAYKENPDLILLDIILPKLGGFDVLENLNKQNFPKPIIIISNSGQPVEIERAKQLGAKDFLVKAEFSPEEVLEKVKKYLMLEETPAPASVSDPPSVVVPPAPLVPNDDTSVNIDAAVGLSNNSQPDAPENAGDDISNLNISAEGSSAYGGQTQYKSPYSGSPQPETNAAPAQAAPNGKKVLVVEDDQFLRKLITKKLNAEGFTVIEAIDGNEALKKSQEEKSDIVLLDLILPGIDGFEVLRRIKANSSTANIPVVILSNLGQKDDIDKGIELGAKDFLIKAHFTPEEIIEKIKTIIS